MHKLLLTAAAAVLGAALAAAPAAAQTLEKIKQRGVLIVGSQGRLQAVRLPRSDGAIVGFEPDMAKDVADKLGVKLATRAGRLLQPHAVPAAGQDRPDDRHDERHAGAPADRRHRRSRIYYASGVNVMSNKKAALKNWEQTQGPEDLRHPGRLVQQVRRRDLRRRDRRLHRADRSAVGAAAGQLHRLGL